MAWKNAPDISSYKKQSTKLYTQRIIHTHTHTICVYAYVCMEICAYGNMSNC